MADTASIRLGRTSSLTGHVLGTLLPGFAGATLPDWLAARLRDGLGGVCLFAENIESTRQLRTLTTAIYEANPNAVIAIDEESGDVTRIHARTGSPLPSPAVLGRLDDVSVTRAAGARIGWELAEAGVGVTFAPLADVNTNPANPIVGVRAFGTDPQHAATHVAAFVEGVQSQGVAACAKHFPGHGDTAVDSHLELPSIEASTATLEGRELVPFAAAVSAGVRSMMTGHIVVRAIDPTQPATFSPLVAGDLLRERLGFGGLLVTDALDMAGAGGRDAIPAAAGRAIGAGCDLLCLGTRSTDEMIDDIVMGVRRALPAGHLAADQLEDAASRVREFGARLRHAREERTRTRPPEAPLPALSADAITGTFDVSAAGRAFAQEHGAGRGRRNGDGPRPQWVKLDTAPNSAVADSGWGPFVHGLVNPVATLRGGDDVAHAAAAVAEQLPADAPVVLCGRDLFRHAWSASAVAVFKARAADVIVVDMGWPGPDVGAVDVATYGASRVVAEALIEVLG